MSAPRISLSIDRLVLHGVAASERPALVAALTAELERRLATPGAASALGGDRHLASVPAPPVRSPGRGASDLGRAAGRGLAGALGP